MALALASSGSALVNAGLLYFYLHKRNIFRFGPHWKKVGLQYGLANLAMIAALWFGLNWYNGAFTVVTCCRSRRAMCSWDNCLPDRFNPYGFSTQRFKTLK